MKWPSLLRFESANTLAGLELVRQQKRLGNTVLDRVRAAIADTALHDADALNK